jgi:DNA-binding beta-propeller fold protein YncE
MGRSRAPRARWTPISTATNKAGKKIKVGQSSGTIAITPNGKTAYVANGGEVCYCGDTVTPIRTATNTALKPITVGFGPVAIVITP